MRRSITIPLPMPSSRKLNCPLNKNVGSKDNLIRLVINPLMVDYCEKYGITRDKELSATIKDAAQRATIRPFVLRAELNLPPLRKA